MQKLNVACSDLFPGSFAAHMRWGGIRELISLKTCVSGLLFIANGGLTLCLIHPVQHCVVLDMYSDNYRIHIMTTGIGLLRLQRCLAAFRLSSNRVGVNHWHTMAFMQHWAKCEFYTLFRSWSFSKSSIYIRHTY